MKLTCPDCSQPVTATIIDAGAATDRHRYIVDITHDTPVPGKLCGAGVLEALTLAATPAATAPTPAGGTA